MSSELSKYGYYCPHILVNVREHEVLDCIFDLYDSVDMDKVCSINVQLGKNWTLVPFDNEVHSSPLQMKRLEEWNLLHFERMLDGVAQFTRVVHFQNDGQNVKAHFRDFSSVYYIDEFHFLSENLHGIAPVRKSCMNEIIEYLPKYVDSEDTDLYRRYFSKMEVEGNFCMESPEEEVRSEFTCFKFAVFRKGEAGFNELRQWYKPAHEKTVTNLELADETGDDYAEVYCDIEVITDDAILVKLESSREELVRFITTGVGIVDVNCGFAEAI